MLVVAPRGQQLTAIVLDQLDQPDQYLTSTLQPYFVKLVLEAAVFSRILYLVSQAGLPGHQVQNHIAARTSAKSGTQAGDGAAL